MLEKTSIRKNMKLKYRTGQTGKTKKYSLEKNWSKDVQSVHQTYLLRILIFLEKNRKLLIKSTQPVTFDIYKKFACVDYLTN